MLVILIYLGLNKGNLPLLPPLGGDLSVRIPVGENPTLWFGQDDAIYRSSQLNENYWTVDGESTLQTKGLGVGLIVSAMVSCATVMGMTVTKHQLFVLYLSMTDIIQNVPD